MSNNLGILTLDLVAEIGEFKKGFDQASRIANKHAKDLEKIAREIDARIDSAFDSASKGFNRLAKAAASLVAISSIRGVLDMADSYGQMSARIKLTIEDMTEYDYVQKRLIETANQAQRPLEEIQNIFIDTSGNLREMGFSLDQAMDIADSFSFALVRNATSAQKAATALAAYDTALNKGHLDGKMWQSVSSALPSLEISMSKIFDIPLKKIQQMGFDGKISVDMLNKAFMESYSDNKSAAESMGSTISGSFIVIQNQIKSYIGELNSSIGVTEKVSSSISFLGDNIDTTMKLIGVAAAGGIALYSSKLAILSATNLQTAMTTIKVDLETRKHNLTLIEASRVKEKKILSDIKEIKSNTSLAGSYSLLTAKTMDYHRALATTQRLQSASRSLFSSITSLLGGPVGIISLMTSAATALFLFSGSAKDASISAGELESKLLDLDNRLNEMSKRQLERESHLLEKDILILEKDRVALDRELQSTEEMLQFYEDKLKLPGYANDRSTLIYIDQLQDKQISLGGKIDDTSDSLSLLDKMLGKVKGSLLAAGEASDIAFSHTSEAFDKMASKLRDEIGRIGLKSNVAVFEYELENTDKYTDLDPTQIKELRTLNEQKDVKLEKLRLSNKTNSSRSKGVDIAAEYKRIMESTLSDEERRGLELSKNLGILKQYGASEADMIAVRRAAYESMSVDIPGMGEGGDTLTAQLARIHENMTQLDSWREEQLIKLELAYGNEESALAESLEKREELERQYRERRSQFEGEMNQELLNLSLSMTSDSLSALREAGIESTAIGKAVFFMNRGISASNTIVSALAAGTKATETLPGMPGVALGKAITAMGMVNAGLILGTGLKGMAHSGLDKVPETGTWLLEKGERVVTSNTSAKLDATLESLRNKNATGGGETVVSNVYITLNGEGDVSSRNEESGSQLGKLMEAVTVKTMLKELKPGGILARR